MLKYFINSFLQMSSSGDTIMYDCRIVDDHYKEIYKDILTDNEKEIFEKIMASDKNAVLYIKHDKLKRLAKFRIDYQYKQSIFDGTKWP